MMFFYTEVIIVSDLDTIKALEHRLGDKQAKEFLKKYKQRMGPIST